jgi:glycosyltransferase involved in cell wall biosynthesis
MQWLYGINEIQNYVNNHNISLAIVNISSWQKSMISGCLDSLSTNTKNFIEVTIPNPIMDDIINETKQKKPNKKNHKFIFHASWARGGNVAYNTVKNLPYDDKELHVFDYLMTIHRYDDPFFHVHDGVDKSTLFHHIAESEYFIYPLYTIHKDTHKDTFACVVAEAIALDTIVITYPLGALPEYFGDYCVFLDMPKDTDRNLMQSEALSKDIDGKFNITKNIEEKIDYLENNPKIKQAIRMNGSKYVLDRFNIDTIGKQWDSLLSNL